MSLKWHRACLLLGLSGAKKLAGWPSNFDLDAIAKLQYPQSVQEMRTILGAMKADCAVGFLEHKTTIKQQYPCLSKMSRQEIFRMAVTDTSIKVSVFHVGASEMSTWLKNQGEAPSVHLAAWFETMKKPASDLVLAADRSSTDDWKNKARERATEINKTQKQNNLYPSQKDVADRIASEFRTQGVVGTDGKPLTGSTIKRHALKGISSGKFKQLSIQTRRGKQGG